MTACGVIVNTKSKLSCVNKNNLHTLYICNKIHDPKRNAPHGRNRRRVVVFAQGMAEMKVRPNAEHVARVTRLAVSNLTECKAKGKAKQK